LKYGREDSCRISVNQRDVWMYLYSSLSERTLRKIKAVMGFDFLFSITDDNYGQADVNASRF
jgi:hypothetical protein